jgi:hypothetical protein
VTSAPSLNNPVHPRQNLRMSLITNENGGQLGCNKMPSGVVYRTKLDSNGLPFEPHEAMKAFKRASGFQVRDNVPITITDWRQVPTAIKDKIWSNMKENQVSSWCRGRCEECDVY